MLDTEEDHEFYKSLIFMGLNQKLAVFGPSVITMVKDIYADFFKMRLKTEDEIKELLKGKDSKTKILIADTYFRSKKGQEKLGFMGF